MVLRDLMAAGAKGMSRLGLVGTMGFALADAVHGYESWIGYGMVGSSVLSAVARVVHRKTS
jgi:uncharacterized membrane protein